MIRSNLYAPTLDPYRVAKAFSTDADAVTLDLEDSIVPENKGRARDAVREILSTEPSKPVYVRINGLDTPWARDDVEAVAEGHAFCLRIPKVESPETVLTVVDWLTEFGRPMSLRCGIESALGVENAFRIASAHPWVKMIALGEADLKSNLGVQSSEALAFARSRVVMAARAAGLESPPLGVYTNVKDTDGLLQDSVRGLANGFWGRSALHPVQVPVINEVFSPSDGDLARARQVVDAADAAKRAGIGALQLDDGTFIDEAVVKGARLVLARSEPHV